MKRLLKAFSCIVCSMLVITGNIYAEQQWEIYVYTSSVNCIAFSGNMVWCGTSGGVVRYNPTDGTKRVFTAADGFQDSNITSIAVDRNGVVWVGGYYGLASYEGKSWKKYSVEDGLLYDKVSDIAVDHNNIVWVGHGDKGLVSFDGNEWTAYPVADKMEFVQINDIFVDSMNRIWIAGYNMLLCYDGSTWATWYNNGIEGNIGEAPDGSIWFIRSSQLIRFDGTEFTIMLDSTDFEDITYFRGLVIDDEGIVWMTQTGANNYFLGLIRYDGETWTNYTTEDGLLNMAPQRIARDFNGDLWICSTEGLSRFDGEQFDYHLTKGDGPLYNNVYDVEIIDGELWCASGLGVSRFDGVSWSYVEIEEGNDWYVVYDIVSDGKGTVWMAWHDGLARYYNGTVENILSSGEAVEGSIRRVETAPDGPVYLDSSNSLYRYDGSNVDKILNVGIDVMRADKDGSLWIGNDNGLQHYTNNIWTEAYTTEMGMTDIRVRALTITDEGMIWVGSRGGIARFDGENWQSWSVSDCELLDDVRALDVDADGLLWIGTLNKGVVSFDGEKWVNYTVEDGLGNMRVMSITHDEESVWFGSTSGGLTHYVKTITALVKLLRPLEGDRLPNDELTIEWEVVNVATVDIAFSTDNGVSWTDIAKGIDAASGSYRWTVPGVKSNEVRIRVVSSENPEIADSSGTFSLSPPYLTLLYPVGGEEHWEFDQLLIRWDHLGAEFLTIEYSNDGGISWKIIAEGVSADNMQFSWMLPDEDADRCQIRITDTGPLTMEVSSGDFMVKDNRFVLVSPNGGEALIQFHTMTIEWEATKGISTIAFDISSDGGENWREIADGINAQKKSFSCFVPYEVSVNYLIRIRSVDPEGPVDTSDGTFSVIASENEWIRWFEEDGLPSDLTRSVAVDSTGVIWVGEESSKIMSFDGFRWSTHDAGFPNSSISEVVSLAVDHDNLLWIATLYYGLYSYDRKNFVHYTETDEWYINDLAFDSKGSLWCGTYNHGIICRENGEWKSYLPNAGGRHPNSSYKLAIDHDDRIWICNNGADYSVSCFDGVSWKHYGEAHGLDDTRANSIVIDHDNTVWATSDRGLSHFDGVIWKTFNSEKNWNDGFRSRGAIESTGIDNEGIKWVDVVSYDDKTWTNYYKEPLIMNHSEQRDFVVDMNNVKWMATRDGLLINLSRREPFIRILSPVGNTVVEPDTFSNIRWMSKGVAAVNISLSTDNGENWSVVAENIDAGTGMFRWQAPDINSHYCILRIEDSAGIVLPDQLGTPFVISSGFLKLVSPNGGESWDERSEQIIAWMSRDVETIEIKYSFDGGETYNPIADAVPAALGEYVWTVSETPGESCLIDIIDMDESSVSDTSDNGFTINDVIVSVDESVPLEFVLYGNNPNPFNPSTTIVYSVPSPSTVTLSVYSISGQKVATLVDGFMSAGRHSVVFDGTDLASGLYFYHLEAEGYVKTAKMLLLK